MFQESMQTSISECKRRLRRETYPPVVDIVLLTLEMHFPNRADIVAFENLHLSSNARTHPSHNAQLLELVDPFVHAWHPICQAIGRRTTPLPRNKPIEAPRDLRIVTGIQDGILSFHPTRTTTAQCQTENGLQAPNSDHSILLRQQTEMIFLHQKPLTRPRSSVHSSK